MTDLTRQGAIHESTAAAHVNALTQDGLVRAVRVGRRRVYAPAEGYDETVLVQRALLAEDACRRVARAILDHPRVRPIEICDMTGMSQRAVYHHLKRLVDSGAVTSTRARGYRELRATLRLVHLMEAMARG